MTWQKQIKNSRREMDQLGSSIGMGLCGKTKYEGGVGGGAFARLSVVVGV